MARRKDSPQKAAMREMMRDYLKNNDISIKDGTDVNSIMRDMMSVLLEGALYCGASQPCCWDIFRRNGILPISKSRCGKHSHSEILR